MKRTLLFIVYVLLSLSGYAQTANNWIRQIAQDGENLWLATNSGGLVKYNKQTGENTVYTTSNSGLCSDHLRSVACYGGKVLVGSDGDGVSEFDGSTFTSYNVDNAPFLYGKQIFDGVLYDADGNLWLGGWGYIYKYDGTIWEEYTQPQAETSSGLFYSALKQSADGTIWFCSEGPNFDGSLGYITKDKEVKTVISSMYDAYDMDIDKQGNVWFNDIYWGVLCYDGNNTKLFNSENSPLPEYGKLWTSGLAVDADGNVWFGCNNLLYKYDGTVFTSYQLPTENYVFDLLIDGNAIWIAIRKTGELFLFENGQFESIDYTTNTQKTEKKVSDVQNSGCLNETRGEDSQRVPTIVLTKEGSILSVQLLNYEENCGTTDFIVTPKVSSNESEPCIVTVNVDPVIPQGYWCICPFNVSFTVHDLEPNSFYLDCWWYKGMVELTEGEPLVLENNNPNTPKYFPTGMTWEEIVVDPYMEQENVNACIYEIGTDTIIGDVTYRKVLRNNSFSGLCVRESGDKVWLLTKEYPTEILLYNFDWDSNQEIVTEYLKRQDEYDEVYEVRQETTPVGDSQTVEIEGMTYQYYMKRPYGTIIRGIGKVAEVNRYPCLLSYREPAVILPGLEYHKVHWIKRNGVEIFRSESAKEWIEEIRDNYRPFVEEGKVWKVGTIPTDLGDPVQIIDYYYFDGDTIIDGKICKQMMCQHFTSPNYLYYEYFSQPNYLRYVGAWYEESQKVYFYDERKLSMVLKYDFSSEANDTLYLIDDKTPFIIGPRQSGGITGFKGAYRDVTIGQDLRSAIWLEGVGGLESPIRNVNGYPETADRVPEFLMSCTVGDEVIYLNDKYEDGATPAGARKNRFDFTHTIKTKPKTRIRKEEEQSLYGEYNDVKLGINLNPLDDAYQVSITDESGKAVYEKAVNAGNIVALSIDISDYAKGSYTVTIENSQESFVGQFEALPTGIKAIVSNKVGTSAVIYNLQGQRLNRLQKGLNIVNSQKIYVR